jgi:acetylglutamate kinase
MAKSIGLVPQMIDGRHHRWTYAWHRCDDLCRANKQNIVAQLQGSGNNAMGFSGADGNLIQSEKRNHPSLDYGFVGDIQK